jgi:hypothetical protein
MLLLLLLLVVGFPLLSTGRKSMIEANTLSKKWAA